MDLEMKKLFLKKGIINPNLLSIFFLSKVEISGKVTILKQIQFLLKEQYRILMILVFCLLWKAHWKVFSFSLLSLRCSSDPDTPFVHSAALQSVKLSGEPNNTVGLNHMVIKLIIVLQSKTVFVCLFVLTETHLTILISLTALS